MSAHGMGDHDKVSKLVAIVCEQMEQDYSKYDDFIQVLRRETCLDHITEKLECSLQSKSLGVVWCHYQDDVTIQYCFGE